MGWITYSVLVESETTKLEVAREGRCSGCITTNMYIYLSTYVYIDMRLRGLGGEGAIYKQIQG
jgi:hypothetical protein